MKTLNIYFIAIVVFSYLLNNDSNKNINNSNLEYYFCYYNHFQDTIKTSEMIFSNELFDDIFIIISNDIKGYFTEYDSIKYTIFNNPNTMKDDTIVYIEADESNYTFYKSYFHNGEDLHILIELFNNNMPNQFFFSEMNRVSFNNYFNLKTSADSVIIQHEEKAKVYFIFEDERILTIKFQNAFYD